MAKLAFRGLVFASFVFAIAACGGDDGGGGIDFIDAGPQVDGGGGSATCNPFSQQGCQQGEKCASVTVQAEPTVIVQTLCVPDGTAAEGAACTTGAPGPTTGFDDCVAFNECVFGECRPVCQQSGGTVAGSCQGAAVCQLFNDLFEDLSTDDIGVCIPQCDPVSGITRNGATITVDYADQCGGLQCFMNLFDGIGTCSGAFMNAPGHNTECGDNCFLNGCAPGHGPFLPGPAANTLGSWQEETVFFANTIFGLADKCIQYCDTTQWTATPGMGGGGDFQANCPINNECRSVTGLYLNFDDAEFAPDSFGLCIPNVNQLGSCSTHVLDDVEAYLTEEGQEPQPVPGTNNFIPGCSSGAEVVAKIEEIIAAEMPALTGSQVKEKARVVAKRLESKVALPPMAFPVQ